MHWLLFVRFLCWFEAILASDRFLGWIRVRVRPRVTYRNLGSDSSLKWPRLNKVSGQTSSCGSKVRYIYWELYSFYFLRVIVNIPIWHHLIFGNLRTTSFRCVTGPKFVKLCNHCFIITARLLAKLSLLQARDHCIVLLVICPFNYMDWPLSNRYPLRDIFQYLNGVIYLVQRPFYRGF